MQLEVFFDCSSPWSYLGFEQVQPLGAELGLELIWRPVLVGGIFNAVNSSVYHIRENVPAKLAYMAKDLRDWSRITGIAINPRPSIFPVNSAAAMRACLLMPDSASLVATARALFEAYWRDDRDIGDRAVIANCVAATGADPALLARLDDPAVKDQLRTNTAEAVARGSFGVPTFFLNRDDMYFGVDRLPNLRHAATQGERDAT
ncbi:2-hydroxychromene-2-carboxylate isomerase [Sphingoaurantiacus capsulatus]|uniref:2-hydroxychromene-2-carboxylate isomerase n=1 Tax=Sphingoaurantiacus capsulatus TaxID=1771310 RepID=A0ABV7X7W4_9SPHN